MTSSGYYLSADGKSCVRMANLGSTPAVLTISFVATFPITVAAFVSVQSNYILGVAMTAGVSTSDVTITDIVQSRRSSFSRALLDSSVQVSTAVTGTAAAAHSLQNQSALNSNLQSEGLPACTVVFENAGLFFILLFFVVFTSFGFLV